MASPREIRRRIRSVRNMSQITRAMEMVSASKMRRAQQRVVASRPYAERLQTVIADLSALQIDPEEMRAFPLLEQREVRRSAVILITPDKGLTGALNSNIIRRASRYILSDAGVPVEVIATGKKGRDFMVRTRQEVVAEFTGMGDNPSLEDIRPIAQVALDDFTSGKVDAVHIVFPRFVNTLSQVPEVRQILPIARPEGAGEYSDYIFEPNPRAVLNDLLPRFVEIQIYQALLESIASEHSARMVAMRNASQNAKDLVSDLTLSYNKARQAMITAEVSEIAAGANALG
ncbi:MAG: F0F1 ATP synthase subunit gamma [Chloroflexota bacterium]|nr:F0F1 ATP synthase subunit gamma [Chloroflexota bacterium]